MDVIDVPIHVVLVANNVIPELALPKGTLRGPLSHEALMGKGEFQPTKDTG